uniref:Uncharacterized protein n=1 Tax=Arundo donax TaxID=35708 RepID=A0A0A9C4D4_ARUDO
MAIFKVYCYVHIVFVQLRSWLLSSFSKYSVQTTASCLALQSYDYFA